MAHGAERPVDLDNSKLRKKDGKLLILRSGAASSVLLIFLNGRCSENFSGQEWPEMFVIIFRTAKSVNSVGQQILVRHPMGNFFEVYRSLRYYI